MMWLALLVGCVAVDGTVNGLQPWRVEAFGAEDECQVLTGRLAGQDWTQPVDQRGHFGLRSGPHQLLCADEGAGFRCRDRHADTYAQQVHLDLRAAWTDEGFEDQARGVDHLVRCGVVDPTRVGIFGWSYGGFLAATALARRPDVFACAVAGAPVTAWEWYDAHYTERYMGTPDANPDGYANASVIGRCGDVRGKVLVVHGVVDENVHFRHSTAYVAGLERCGKTAGDGYVFMPFPNEQHVPRGATDMMYMERSMQAFFEANLLQVDGGRRGAKSEDGDGMPVTNTAPA